MKMEYVNCNLCGKNDTVFVTKTEQHGQEFKLVKCNSCGLIYLNPRLTWETIKSVYSENKLDNFQYYLHTKDLDEQTFTDRLNLISKYTAPGKVLDIGSSVGIFLHAAKKQGWNIFGVELNKEEAKYSEENFGVKLLSSYGTKQEFGLINMSDVIEHFTHPKEELQKISKALKQIGFCMPKIIVTIPTWNEGLNIKLLIDEILALKIKDLKIVVADDNSPDGTWKIVEELSKKNKKVHLLHRLTNKGRGLAGIDGFKKALELGADIIVEMDADFSHHPKHIPELLSALDNADVSIGSRFKLGGYDKRGLKRRILTKFSNSFANIVLGVRLTDPNSGYRCYKREAMSKIINNLKAPGPDIVQDVINSCKTNNLKLVEVPIDFQDRERGETTKTFKDFINGAVTTLKLRLSR